MAAEQIHPQPVIFNRVNDCNCPNSAADDQIIVKQGDITQWQFSNEPCAFALNEWFKSGVIGTWTITGDQHCHTAGAPGVIVGMETLLDNNPIQIIVDVTFPTDPPNGEVQVVLGNLVLGTITRPGRYFYYYNNVIPGFNRLDIGVDADFSGCIEKIQILAFDQLWRVWVEDLTGSIVASFELANQIWRIQNRFITFRLDWNDEGISDGCYVIKAADPCINTCSQNLLVGQNFREDARWTIAVTGGGVLVVSEALALMQWGVSGIGDTGTARRDGTVCSGITYEVTFTTQNFVNAAVQVSIGGTLGTGRISNGTWTEQITSAGTNFVIAWGSTGAGSTGQMVDLTVKAITADLQADFVSEQFSLFTDADSCSKVLNWCNDKNEDYNMGWELTNFSPNVRIPFRAYQPEVNILERVTNENKNGRRTNDYVRARLRDRAVTELLPDYLIKSLYLGLLSDHFYVDGEEKFLETDEIPVSWAEDNTNRGAMEFLLGDQEQLHENKRCTSEINPCPEILGANLRMGQFLLILGDGTTLNIWK